MSRRRPRPAAIPVLAVLAVGMLAGCGAVSGARPAGAGTQGAAAPAVVSTPLTGCGTTRTSAGVPVDIEIEHGPVPCPAALAVERAYARALASGKVPGNGGGAPVKIRDGCARDSPPRRCWPPGTRPPAGKARPRSSRS